MFKSTSYNNYTFESKHLSIQCLWLLLTLTILFFHGWIAQYVTESRKIAVLLQETCFAIMFVLILLSRNIQFKFPGILCLYCYVIWTFFSGIANNTSYYVTFLQARYWIDLCIFIIFLLNLKFTYYELRTICIWVSLLFLFQIPASCFNVLLHGIKEMNVGTLTNSGGGPGVTLPLIAFSYAMGYYFYKSHKLYILIIALSFITVGLSNGKRAICVLYPIYFILGNFFDSYLERSSKKMIRSGLLIVIILPIFLISSLFFLSKMASFEDLNQESSVTGKFETAYKIGTTYTITGYGSLNTNLADTRGACLSLMFKYLVHGYDDYWLGTGPMKCTTLDDYAGYRKYGFGYGVGGWIHDSISIGIPGMLFHVLFYLILVRTLLRKILFYKLNSLGHFLYFGSMMSIFALMFIYFFYNDNLCKDVTLQLIPVGAAVLLLSPNSSRYFYK